MKKLFGIQIDKNEISLFNLKDISGLNKGDIFFKRTGDKIEILQEFEYLDKNHLNNIINNLSENEEHDFSLLEK